METPSLTNSPSGSLNTADAAVRPCYRAQAAASATKLLHLIGFVCWRRCAAVRSLLPLSCIQAPRDDDTPLRPVDTGGIPSRLLRHVPFHKFRSSRRVPRATRKARQR